MLGIIAFNGLKKTLKERPTALTEEKEPLLKKKKK
jgi:hypothetical protein